MGIAAGVILLAVGQVATTLRNGAWFSGGAPAAEAQVILDLSQQQDQWDNLANWIHAVVPDVVEVTDEINSALLAKYRPRVLIIPLPFHQAIMDTKSAAVESWVRNGGGLLFMGHYAGDVHHGTNPSTLAAKWGVQLQQTYLLPGNLSDCESERGGNVSAIPEEKHLVRVVPDAGTPQPIVQGVADVHVSASASLTLLAGFKKPAFLLRTEPDTTVCTAEASRCSQDGMSCSVTWTRSGSNAPIVLAAFDDVGAGRVVIAGTWKLFYAGKADNHHLMRNIIAWLAKAN
jgi:hypothetical protein